MKRILLLLAIAFLIFPATADARKFCQADRTAFATNWNSAQCVKARSAAQARRHFQAQRRDRRSGAGGGSMADYISGESNRLPVEKVPEHRIEGKKKPTQLVAGWAESQPGWKLRDGLVRGLLPHPAGCPRRAFCGCGAAVEVFGRPVRDLFLAANWFRFPPSTPAPGRVAVRRHHVFVIKQVLGAGLVLAYDANSGGRQTRLHVRSLAGFSVRDPRG